MRLMRSVSVAALVPGKVAELLFRLPRQKPEIPVGAGDVGHVRFDHQADLRGVHSGFLNAAVAEAETPAHDTHRGFVDVLFDFGGTQFFVDGIAGSEGHDDRIVVRFACGFGELASFRALRSEKCELAHLQFTGGRDEVANSGRIRDGNNIKFRYVGIATEADAIGSHAVWRRCDYRELHAFLKIGVAPGVYIDRVVGNILDMKDGRFPLGWRRLRTPRTEKQVSERQVRSATAWTSVAEVRIIPPPFLWQL